MRSASFTTIFSTLLIAVLCSVSAGQRLAFAWETDPVCDKFVAAMVDAATPRFKVLDTDQSQTAIRSSIGNRFYNLSSEQGVLAANVAGSDLIVFTKAQALRRHSFDLGDHYESWAAVFLVEGRSGTLIAHRLESGIGKTENDSIDKLLARADEAIDGLSDAVANFKRSSVGEAKSVASAPTANSKDAGGFVAPIPYSRIKPEYTQTAYLYSVTATVEIEIELDETGKITQTQIVRWAGFGLDESVERAVRAMNWRPAYFGKTPQPIRFVAQYNFRKPQ